MQDLLVAAFHADRDTAIEAWRRWEAETGLDDAVWAEMRVLTAMVRRLKELGISSDYGPRIGGIRRYMWVRSQGTFQSARPLLEALGKAGIDSILIKGGARFAAGGDRASERFAFDVDLLVPRDRVAEVLDVAKAQGYVSAWGDRRQRTLELLRSSRHSVPLKGPSGVEVDLHVFALLIDRCPDHDDGLRARAVPARIGETTVRVPSPTDRFVITCCHGLLRDPGGVVDWVGDSVDLIRQGEIDWAVLIEEAQRRAVAVTLHSGLRYLAHTLAQPIPVDVIDTLEGMSGEPFVSEYAGHLLGWDAETRNVRQVWGAAMGQRAAAWRARVPATRVGRRYSGRWCEAEQTAPATFAIDVPEPVRSAPGRWRLDLELDGDWRPGREVFDIALCCFDAHTVEIAARSSADAYGLAAGRRALRVSFELDGALPAAYRLERVKIELQRTGELAAVRAGLTWLRYRWRSAGAGLLAGFRRPVTVGKSGGQDHNRRQ